MIGAESRLNLISLGSLFVTPVKVKYPPPPSPLDGQIPTPQNFVHCNFEICILEGLVPSDAFHSGVALKMNELSQDNVKLLR